MKQAIVKINSKQYAVFEGQEIKVDRLNEESGVFVLFYSDEKEILVGNPELKNVSVTLKKLKDLKDKKILVKRFKAKSRYHKTNGHRQPVSIIKVEKIVKREKKENGA
ncbi:50S ribosomal protein L21 [bacterium CG2_30_40_12]|nr:MAG: 50S ribosomal protein L21 [bacterium CG2_30_40_12]OJI09021.1 MAG: 50S ribosomal protein L21 [bacterium CG09_39_24]